MRCPSPVSSGFPSPPRVSCPRRAVRCANCGPPASVPGERNGSFVLTVLGLSWDVGWTGALRPGTSVPRKGESRVLAHGQYWESRQIQVNPTNSGKIIKLSDLKLSDWGWELCRPYVAWVVWAEYSIDMPLRWSSGWGTTGWTSTILVKGWSGPKSIRVGEEERAG